MGYNIALLLGIGLLITSIIIIRNRLAFIRQGEKTIATVITVKKEKDSDGGSTYRPVFRFKTSSGQEMTFESPYTSSPAAYEVGEDATLTYDPSDPSNVKIYSYFGVFGLAAILMALAMALIVIGGGYHLANMVLDRFNG